MAIQRKGRRLGSFYSKNESDIMKRLGLKPTVGSGAGWIEKEDGQNEYLIAQLKSTDAQSIGIKLFDIHKLEYNAMVTHKVPVFVIQFLETDEVFVMSRPSDLLSVAKYLECGEKTAIKEEENINIVETIVANTKVIRSGNKSKYWAEKEKEKEKESKAWKANRIR